MSKGSNSHFYRNGLRAGYTEYRYGGGAPVTLAGSQSSRIKPLLKGQARESAVDRASEAMRKWHATPFENEGAMRAGLRIGFVLQGNEWHRSDATALDIVGEVLTRFGATRPDHDEAQQGFALANDFCSWCFCPIDEKDRSRGRRFCSAECARTAVTHMARKTNHHYGAVLRSALRIIDKEKAAPQTCEFCERSFQSDRKQRFCSTRCAASHSHGDRYMPPRQCEMCRETFKPHEQGQVFCSRSCAQRSIRQREAERLSQTTRLCVECGSSYVPTARQSKFCSARCGKLNGHRAYRSRNATPKPPMAHCDWCGEGYQPKIAVANRKTGFCSRNCSRDHHRFYHEGANLRVLTRRAFDHFLVVPHDQAWRRRMTPAKMDWLFVSIGVTVTGEAEVPISSVIDSLFGGPPA